LTLLACYYPGLIASPPRLLVSLLSHSYVDPRHLHSFPTRRSSDLRRLRPRRLQVPRSRRRSCRRRSRRWFEVLMVNGNINGRNRSEEHTSELQSRFDLVCRLLLEKKKRYTISC